MTIMGKRANSKNNAQTGKLKKKKKHAMPPKGP